MNGIQDAKTGGQALAMALRLGADRLGHCESPITDARLLLAHVAGMDAGRLPLLELEDFSDELMTRYEGMLDRRAQGEPVSHILGSRAFWNHSFRVTKDVLDPRPETEVLVEQALTEAFSSVLDLGTGSGCILLSLLAERKQATGVGTDLSPEALAVAEQNADLLEVEQRVKFLPSNWYAAVEGRFDLIVSNPPYIAANEMAGLAPELAHEPRMALTDEADGLSAYRIIAAGAPEHLLPGGRLMVETGPTQGAVVARLLREAGFDEVGVLPDLDGRDRVVTGRKPGN